MTSLNPQEIYLLERYSSVEYFRELRDTWGNMVTHVESALDKFMHNLPLDYRNRPLPEQPDAVWGEQVLPNFRETYQSLCDGLTLLINGDLNGLGYSNGPLNDFKGQREFWAEWMEPDDLERYRQLLIQATTLAKNILTTEESQWRPGDLSNKFDAVARGPTDIPANLPNYKLNHSITAKTGERAPKAGIYLPDIDDSCAEFLSIQYSDAPDAMVYLKDEILLHPTTKVPYATNRIYEERPCVWTLVEQDNVSPSTPSLISSPTLRVEAGMPCPQAGFYFSPANENSRRHFIKGELLPKFESDYGLVIWQWDLNQTEHSTPKHR